MEGLRKRDLDRFMEIVQFPRQTITFVQSSRGNTPPLFRTCIMRLDERY